MGLKKTWKELVEHLQKSLPTIVPAAAGAAGTLAGSPALGAAFASIARMLVGAPVDADLDEVASAIFADPEQVVRMEELALERYRATLEAERVQAEVDLKRIEAVNETMRAEAATDKWWTSGWRPFWGYTSAVAFFLQVGAITYQFLNPAQESAAMISSLGSLSVFWGVPLAVLGVSAWTRGKEKMLRVEAAKGSTP